MEKITMNLEDEFECYAAIAKLTEEFEDMTPAEVTATITGIRFLFDTLRNATQASDQAKNADLIRAIAQLNLEVAKIESELATKTREVTRLEQEAIELREKIARLDAQPNEKLNRKNEFYYRENDEIPCCPRCYESEKKVIHLNKPPVPLETMTYYRCPECRTTFRVN
jgi:predicted RNase H-like nuclease (RuvC/YqgF family)